MKKHLTNRLVDTAKPTERPYEVYDTETTGLLLRVQPSGQKTFFCRYRLHSGKRARIKIGSPEVLTCAQAREQARLHLANALRGEDPQEAKRQARASTLEAFLDEVYADRSHHRTASETVARVKRHFPDLLDKALADIRPMRIETWRSSRLKAGKAPGTLNRDVAALRGVLSKAVLWGVISDNPLKPVKALREDSGTKVRFLTDNEEDALMSTLEGREERIRAERESFNTWRRERGYGGYPDLRAMPFADHLKPMVLLSLHTGLRRGELFHLTWSDVRIDAHSPTLTVRGATAKSGKTRHIPLNRTAREVLEGWRSIVNGNGLVFPGKDGKPFDNVNSAWRTLLKDADIKDFRWHDMRHHFASRLVMVGVDLNTVRELLGHGDIKMTLRYAHLSPKVKADAVAKLERKPSPNSSESMVIPL